MKLWNAICSAVILALLPAGALAQTQAAPATKPAVKKPAAARAARSAPAPSIGIARPDCVYKPVMTNDDMRACGIGIR